MPISTAVEMDTDPVLRGRNDRKVALPLCVAIVLASAANALNQADRNIVPIAVIPMSEELGLTLFERGLVLSSFAYGYILVQMPAGWIASRVPPLHLLLVAVFVWSISTVSTPAAARLGLAGLFACRVVMGVAEGFCLPAIFQFFASSVSEARRSGAFGVMIASGSVGQLCALLFCPLISPWDWMFASFGIAGLVWCAVCGAALARPCGRAAADDGDEQPTSTYGTTSSTDQPIVSRRPMADACCTPEPHTRCTHISVRPACTRRAIVSSLRCACARATGAAPTHRGASCCAAAPCSPSARHTLPRTGPTTRCPAGCRPTCTTRSASRCASSG